MPEQLVTAIVTYFLVIDPVGNADYFAGAAQGQSRASRLGQILVAACVAGLLVPVLILFGDRVLAVLQVHIPAIQIAGGLFLLLIAFEMVMKAEHDDVTVQEDKAAGMKKSVAVFPLAIPFIAGPDTLAASLLLVGVHQNAASILNTLAGFGVILVVSVVLLLLATWIAEVIHRQVLKALSVLIGILLAAFSVEMIVQGLVGVLAVHLS